MPYYPGFCTKYGADKAFSAGVIAPMVLNSAFITGVTTLQDQSFPKIAAMAGLSAFMGAASGTLGFLCGMFTHDFVNEKLEARNMNMEEGGKIVRKAQAAAYAVPVAAAAVFNMAILPSTIDVTDMETKRDAQSFVDTVSPMKQVEKHIADPAEYRADVNLDAFIVTFDVTPETLSPAYS
jgi:hypothetical protein